MHSGVRDTKTPPPPPEPYHIFVLPECKAKPHVGVKKNLCKFPIVVSLILNQRVLFFLLMPRHLKRASVLCRFSPGYPNSPLPLRFIPPCGGGGGPGLMYPTAPASHRPSHRHYYNSEMQIVLWDHYRVYLFRQYSKSCRALYCNCTHGPESGEMRY